MVHKLFLIVPLSILILCLCIYLTVSDSAPDSVPYLSTAIIFRHGQRTPLKKIGAIPCPFCDDLGLGQLTKNGSHQLYNQGVLLRSKYSQLLPEDGIYRVKDMRILSSASARAVMSLQSFMTGFIPSPSQDIDYFPLGWQPFSFDLDYDGTMIHGLLDPKSCPKYFEAFYTCAKAPPLSTVMSEDQEFLDSIPEMFQTEINSIMDVLLLIDAVLVQMQLSRDTTPQWAVDMVYGRLVSYSKPYFKCLNNDPEMIRYRAGIVMTEIVENMKAQVEGRETAKKFQIYSGHDLNLYSLAYAIGAEDQLPEQVLTGDTIMVDLIANKNESQEPRVEIVYFSLRNGSVLKIPLKVQGCHGLEPCGLSSFIEATRHVNNVTLMDLREYCSN